MSWYWPYLACGSNLSCRSCSSDRSVVAGGGGGGSTGQETQWLASWEAVEPARNAMAAGVAAFPWNERGPDWI